MANKSIGLKTWLENEAVNFEEINGNFEKIDALIVCLESGEKEGAYSGGSDSKAKWRYKKYSDGTIDMSAKLNFTNLKCNGGTNAPYYSGTITVYFPFNLSSVYDVQMHLSSNTKGWISDATSQTAGVRDDDHITFMVMGMEKESDYIYKQVFINVKGVI